MYTRLEVRVVKHRFKGSCRRTYNISFLDSLFWGFGYENICLNWAAVYFHLFRIISCHLGYYVINVDLFYISDCTNCLQLGTGLSSCSKNSSYTGILSGQKIRSKSRRSSGTQGCKIGPIHYSQRPTCLCIHNDYESVNCGQLFSLIIGKN